MEVWRLCKEKYAPTAFDGEGALRVGGRWNSRGIAVVYTSESLALATLEMLVHVLSVELSPPDLVAIAAQIPDSLVDDGLDVDDLADDWQSASGHSSLRREGDNWLESQQSVGISVPSAVVPEERNILLNPEHPQFEQIRIGAPIEFDLDRRFFS